MLIEAAKLIINQFFLCNSKFSIHSFSICINFIKLSVWIAELFTLSTIIVDVKRFMIEIDRF